MPRDIFISLKKNQNEAEIFIWVQDWKSYNNLISAQVRTWMVLVSVELLFLNTSNVLYKHMFFKRMYLNDVKLNHL